MKKKIAEILLVSTPYDAFIMEEEGRLAERIIHEYSGLNLSRPPMLTWVSTASEAMIELAKKKFDLVITMPRLDDMDAFDLGKEIKEKYPHLPVFLLVHNVNRLLLETKSSDRGAIDKIFVWHGNSDLLLALIKNVEDELNIEYDTDRARVRVIILVEDSPIHYSSLLPLLYKVIVLQTQAVMEDSLNDEHRLLRMRARPKILLAENYEEAEKYYRKFKPYVLSIFSDVRYPRGGEVDMAAGFHLLSMIKKESPDIPLLNLSSEESNREKAMKIPAIFLNKNSPKLHMEIQNFFEEHLGFGDFVFRMPDGREVGRASNLMTMEKILPTIPDESICRHALMNDFSSWLMARSEIMLATKLRPIKVSDFPDIPSLREHLINSIHARRQRRQKGIITEFTTEDFNQDADFTKIGKGSLGGKARGLAFASTQLKESQALLEKFKDIEIRVPKSLVLSTEGFDSFINENDLKGFATSDAPDEKVADFFLKATFPNWLERNLNMFLTQAKYPLAVRSSSLLEDSLFQPFAGIYKTFMLPNKGNIAKRLHQLILTIKIIYASTYFEAPRSFSKSTLYRTEDEKMAVIIQPLNGTTYGDYYYPAFSGVAQSYNYYPISRMRPEEGIAQIALGLGKTVVEGETCIRFSPKYPQLLPQFSTVDDILENSQRYFYALKLSDLPGDFGTPGNLNDDLTLERLDVEDAKEHAPISYFSGYYNPQEHRIRDTVDPAGYPVLTFARILKYQSFPLSDILMEILEMGRRGMGAPVEIEFSVDLPFGADKKPVFSLLQVRPMAVDQHTLDVEITPEERENAFCYSEMALGNGQFNNIEEIVYIKPDAFDVSKTVEIAAEIGKINQELLNAEHKYVLIGPGRWGSADRWLGIPVTWKDISGVGAIIETTCETLKADPSQGSHFFHNITSLGISYINTSENGGDFINWDWLESMPSKSETRYLKRIQLEKPLTLKIDGKKSTAVLLQ